MSERGRKMGSGERWCATEPWAAFGHASESAAHADYEAGVWDSEGGCAGRSVELTFTELQACRIGDGGREGGDASEALPYTVLDHGSGARKAFWQHAGTIGLFS